MTTATTRSLMARLRDFLEIVTTIVVLVAAGTFMWTVTLRSSRSPSGPSIPLPTEPVSLGGAPAMGSSRARVAIIEFSDFQCPYCARFARDTLPQLKAKYVDTGKVIFAYRHHPLREIHSRAEAAAQASECAAQQGKFWQLHDHLFKDPRKLEAPDLLKYGGDVGLDIGQFETCLGGRGAERVKQDSDLARTLKLSGTPIFLLGRLLPGELVEVSKVLTGAQTAAEFSAAIDQALKRARATD